ncbi:hypothetical protein Xcel_1597 [Xylanimonas cellulosilytica DSM 15894]|uniref:VapC50 C-terminal domain-containing protein n=1 Tax=Xylanimonas cellulosilytica (strain DSM 15894 / JCM 12276 / CECT 5975 / KCTC 9989 / LMG 20990 / NBRC 107835 / XIL07) TaxID=446471 RepID=D1BSD1_XYLCX|nr:hypothetical protein Xcel_1597 [Xylanimonas cellulosilytica DSM 15894]
MWWSTAAGCPWPLSSPAGSATTEPCSPRCWPPDEVLFDQFELDPHGAFSVIVEQGSAMRRPLTAVVDVLAALDRAGTPEFASVV